jgi:hypothetical protein
MARAEAPLAPGRDGPRACSAADGTCRAGLVRGRHRSGPGRPLGTDEGEREHPADDGGDPCGQVDRVLAGGVRGVPVPKLIVRRQNGLDGQEAIELASSPSYPGRILAARGRSTLPSIAHQRAAFRQVSNGMGR